MVYSTGSSSESTFCLSRSTSFKIEYNVVDLPEPVGPEISTKPYGFLIAVRDKRQVALGKAKVVELKLERSGS